MDGLKAMGTAQAVPTISDMVSTMSGKLKGIPALSTSPKVNPYCLKRVANPSTVCAHCFSLRKMKMRTNLDKKLIRNTELLCNHLYDPEEIPRINALWFWFESFGDIQNLTQIENYFRICRGNQRTTFSLYTKNCFLLDANYSLSEKPENLIIVQGSPLLNVPVKRSPWADKVFTVYDRKHAKAVDINCGGRKCLDCLACYQHSGPCEIREKLK